jgi:hypothetical protein
VVELVDTLALGASAARREGSSPFIRTNKSRLPFWQAAFIIEKDLKHRSKTVCDCLSFQCLADRATHCEGAY